MIKLNDPGRYTLKVFTVIDGIITIYKMAFLVTCGKNPPAVQEMQQTQV